MTADEKKAKEMREMRAKLLVVFDHVKLVERAKN
jgi:hypothetical protein